MAMWPAAKREEVVRTKMAGSGTHGLVYERTALHMERRPYLFDVSKAFL